MAGVLNWLDGLGKPMLMPMQDVGPVWQGSVVPTANAQAPGPLSMAALRRAWLMVRRNKGWRFGAGSFRGTVGGGIGGAGAGDCGGTLSSAEGEAYPGLPWLIYLA